MDSEADEQDQDGTDDQGPISLTAFLFGNIDNEGQLQDDILDEESKQHLMGLSQLSGIGSLVEQITADKTGDSADDTNIAIKTEAEIADAVDYSDINELAEDIDDLTSSTAVLPAPKAVSLDKCDNYDAVEKQSKSTTTNAPPASDIVTVKREIIENEMVDNKMQSFTTSASTIAVKQETNAQELKAPLADMMPQELKDVDVTELFPDFKRGKVLRFSRLFGPKANSSLPQIWRGVQKRRKKPKTVSGSQVGVKQVPEDESDEYAGKKFGWDYYDYDGDPPSPSECMTDDEVLMMRVEDENTEVKQQVSKNEEQSPKVAPWRYGPAKLWYDMLGVPDDGVGFDYGFKLKNTSTEQDNIDAINSDSQTDLRDIKKEVDATADEEFKDIFPDECYEMVTQLHWEDDVIWDGEAVRAKVLAAAEAKSKVAGWIPSNTTRELPLPNQMSSGSSGMTNLPPGLSTSSLTVKSGPLGNKTVVLKNNSSQSNGEFSETGTPADSTWYSIFPVENSDLIYKRWEDDVIWDAENMDHIPSPKILTLDPNDENIILGIPDDPDLNEQTPSQEKNKKSEPKKSKILLGKHGIMSQKEELEPPPMPEAVEKDIFNLSNDEYYNPKLTQDNALRHNVGGGGMLQHSTPAVELRQPLFPTYLGQSKLRTWHRPMLKKYSYGMMAQPGPQSVHPLLKHIKKKARMREQERQASGGGEMFFMRTPQDLTGMDGELILAEYSEEHPPVMMNVGMATKIKNCYKRRPGKDSGAPDLLYGELSYAHTSPFLGSLKPGQCLQTFENNLFRVPIYPHDVLDTDFVIIRTRQHYYVREVNTIYSVGQLCPLFEVPGPNSKRANNFIRDFLQVFIYRLFWKSTDIPRRIRMDDIKKAFPSHSESSIRKRLKLCADFKRTGMDSNWWVIKPDFRLPTEEEIRAMVSSEQCCGWYSMLAAEQRLKDAGYGEKSLFAQEDNDDEDSQVKIDDEILSAPWNTTRAFISAMKGKCLLSLNGVADPSGCGEGFSYIKVPNKPVANKDEQSPAPAKKTVTGTDADLRRLNLKTAKQLLRKFGVPEDEINKLPRWDIIDMVRTLSTVQSKSGNEEGGQMMSKFARGNRFSIAEHQERYKEECQRIFDLQNRVLASDEVLSTDEESSSDDSDIEEMGKNIENMLKTKKATSLTQLSHEREEAERRELQKMLDGNAQVAETKKKKETIKPKEEETDALPGMNAGRRLKIYRTFRTDDGKEYERVEIVRKAPVIDLYSRIRQTKNDSFIAQFAALDEQQREEIKREKRRLQEKLRRIKRNEMKAKTTPSAEPPKRRIKEKPLLKLKCGACGAVGHMRTNKDCPMYAKASPVPSVQVAMTEEQEEQVSKLPLEEDKHVNVEGTKLTLPRKLLDHADKVRRETLMLKIPKQVMKQERIKRRRPGTTIHCDYLKKPRQSSNRRRADPQVTLCSILENILSEMRDLPDTAPFLHPVSTKEVPDYYKIVETPMDMQTIRENIRAKKYQSREAFLVDVNQIVTNSVLYNGSNNMLTRAAKVMLDLCLKKFAEKEEKLMKLEKAINPLLDDDDQVAFSFILENIVQKLFLIPESWPFHKPVNKKLVKDYYDVIKSPMDLEAIKKKVQSHTYHKREEFLADVELMMQNSVSYNGPEHAVTTTSLKILELARDELQVHEEHLEQLEKEIIVKQEKALEAVETDSNITGGTSVHDENSMEEELAKKMLMKSALGTTATLKSEDSDFIDIEGYDEDATKLPEVEDEDDDEDMKNVLEMDLQITPENSDDDTNALMEGPDDTNEGSIGGEYADDLKLSDSDSELEANRVEYSAMDDEDDEYGNQSSAPSRRVTFGRSMEYEYSENAQFSSLENENSASADFSSFFQSQEAKIKEDQSGDSIIMSSTIDNDLQLSDSDNDEQSSPLASDERIKVDNPDDDESQQSFNMADFLK